MSSEVKRREAGKRVFSSDSPPKLRLVPEPPQKSNRPEVQTDLSQEVKEMLREMNRRHSLIRNTDAPDAA